MFRRFYLSLSVCLIAGGMTFAAGDEPAAAPASDTPQKVESIGVISQLAGSAFATNLRDQRRPLTLESKIWMGEKIETESGASLTITFSDKTTISQGENGTMVIDEYVYNPKKPDDSSFGMRFVKGACRVVTGAITDSNPDRFKVKMRMATIGIRGCDLAFKSSEAKDDVYVLELGNLKSVQVLTTTDGTQLTDMKQNKDMAVDREKTKLLTITEGMRKVSVVSGKGYSETPVDMKEVNAVVAASSNYAPATYNIEQSGNSAVFTLTPQSK